MNFFDNNDFKKNCWIELIGFDNEAKDFGVKSFLDRAGFIPNSVSILISWVSFVFNYQGFEKEVKLSHCECSYVGHPACPERKRQDWTNLQLKGLINELHKYKIDVYFSLFNYFSYLDEKGKIIVDKFHAKHPEITESGSDTTYKSIHMLKRLSDGRFYADVLQEKIIDTLVGYGFDGIHIADGLSSTRTPLSTGDFSDDIIEQFENYAHIKIKKDRQKDIINNHRTEWIRFNCEMWNRYYEKFFARLDKANKKHVFNTGWTTCPFGGMYRYGVDYRAICKLGAKECMVEDVSVSTAIDYPYIKDRDRKAVHFNYLTKLMLLKAAMPTVDLVPLSNVHDTMEQWGVLEHLPCAMIRSYASNLNTFTYGKKISPVTQGPYFCLCDSLKSSDWDFIRNNLENAYTKDAKGSAGVTLVWSDNVLDKEIDSFTATRKMSTDMCVTNLMYAGTPIYSIIRSDNINHMPEKICDYSTSLLLCNPDLYDKNELNTILKSNKNIFAICEKDTLPKGFKPLLIEENSFGNIVLAEYGTTKAKCETIINNAKYKLTEEDLKNDGAYWTLPLKQKPYSDEFWKKASDILTAKTNSPKVVDTVNGINPCKVMTTITGKNKCRVILSNDDFFYNRPVVDMHKKIKKIKCTTKYDGFTVNHSGTTFSCRIPGRGADIFEIEF